MDRRSLLASTLAAPLAAALAPVAAQSPARPRPDGPFWPGGARLAVSVTVQFEAEGGQADAWQTGPEGSPQAEYRFPNFYNAEGRTYGATEGMPRLLDMLDRVGVKMTSMMIGQTLDRFPDLAREVVARGHEAGGRQQEHRAQFHMPIDEERAFLRDGFASYERVFGARPKGYNAWALQDSVNTHRLLRELGVVYTIDDRTRDEPWIEVEDGEEGLLISPYIQHLNDLNFYEIKTRSIDDYERTMRQEFETLYAEGASRRRMMSVPLHAFVSGRPAYMPTAEAFIRWAQGHEGVWFARRDEIAEWALGEGRDLTPRDERFTPQTPPPGPPVAPWVEGG